MGKRRAAGFTWIELLVVVLTVLVGVFVILPMFIHHRPPSHRISCVSNVKQIGLAMRMWANDHGEVFPMSTIAALGGTLEHNGQLPLHFQAISNELTVPKILVCPNDNARLRTMDWTGLSNTNISYFLGLDADLQNSPQGVLSGDRHLTGGTLTPDKTMWVRSNSVCRWTAELHGGAGNIGLADGSAQQSPPILREFALATNEWIRLAMPIP